MTDVKIKLAEGAQTPEYRTTWAAGADLFSTEAVELAPYTRAAVATGVYLELPPGCEAQVRPRSGLALKEGVTVLNAPGTIDADYRGEVKVILYSTNGSRSVRLPAGTAIAQLVIAPVAQARFVHVDELSATKRGERGFGHTDE